MLHSAAQRIDDLKSRRNVEADQIHDDISVELRDSIAERSRNLLGRSVSDD
jgi:cell division protein FtsB